MKMTNETSRKSSYPKDPLAADQSEISEFVHTKAVSNYYVGELIGKGAFATVNAGLHVLTSEKVAVKVINKTLCNKDNYIKKHLRREGKILQQLRHPNIVHLFEVMETENSYYLILELCNSNLMTRIMKRTRLSELETKIYMKQLILAIDYLHRLFIMHRDLKVENILLTTDDILKVADFGVSIQFTTPNHSLSKNSVTDNESSTFQKHLCKTQCGSPAYAAPEVLSKSLYEYSADVWSIGINMFTMLTGKLPFTVKPFNIQALKEKMISGDMNNLPDDVSSESRSLLLKFLNPEPHKRITLREAMQNHWFNTEHECRWNHGSSTIDVNSALIRYMDDHLGFRKSDTIKSVLHSVPNSSHATYHLLMRKAQRHCDLERISINKWLYSICSRSEPINDDTKLIEKLPPFIEITNSTSETFDVGLDISRKRRDSKVGEETIFQLNNHSDNNQTSRKPISAIVNSSSKRQSLSLHSAKSIFELNFKSNKFSHNNSFLPHINEISIPYFTQINQSNHQRSLLVKPSRPLTTIHTYNHRKFSNAENIGTMAKLKLQVSVQKKIENKMPFNSDGNRYRRFSVGSALKNSSSLNQL